MQLNRIKVVLTEKGKTAIWLADKLKRNKTTVSRWCTNSNQPDLPTLYRISTLLNVRMKDLIN